MMLMLMRMKVVMVMMMTRWTGGEFLSEEELGATKERDFAPEGRRFFKILGRRLIVTWTFEIANSCIVSFELPFTFWGGKGVKSIQNYFSLVEHVIRARWLKHVMQKNKI